MEHRFSHRLPAHEVARRQRWVVVGVTILVIMMVTLWFTSIPTRIGGTGNSFANFFSRANKPTQYVSEDILNIDNQNAAIIENADALQQAIAAQKILQAAISKPITTSTIEAIKQKLK